MTGRLSKIEGRATDLSGRISSLIFQGYFFDLSKGNCQPEHLVNDCETLLPEGYGVLKVNLTGCDRPDEFRCNIGLNCWPMQFLCDGIKGNKI